MSGLQQEDGSARLLEDGSVRLFEDLDIVPASIGTAVALGAPTVASTVDIQPASIVPPIQGGGLPLLLSSSSAIGTPTLTLGPANIAPASITSTVAIGSPTVAPGAATISPSSVTSTSTISAVTVAPGSVNASPASIATTATVGAPTVSPGVVNVAPASIGAAAAVGAPTVAPGTATIAPASIGTTAALGAPAIAPGAVAASPSSIVAGSSVGSPTVAPGSVAASPASLATTLTIGEPLLSSRNTLAPASIDSSATIGAPTAVPGTATIAPTSLASGTTVSMPTVGAGALTIAPASFASGSTVGSATVAPQAVTITPDSIASSSVLGEPTAGSAGSVAPASIGSTETLGDPTLSAGSVDIAPVSISSSESHGEQDLQLISSGETTLFPASISATEAIGSPNILLGTVDITPSSIATAAVISAVVAASINALDPPSIDSSAAIGSATVAPGTVTLSLASVASGLVINEPVALNEYGVLETNVPFAGSSVFAAIVEGARAQEADVADTATFVVGYLADVPAARYKLNYLDRDSQRFIADVGEWRVGSAGVSLLRSTTLARTRTQHLSTATYDGATPTSLEARVVERGISTITVECGIAGHFLIPPNSKVRSTAWLRATNVNSRTLQFCVQAWNANGILLAEYESSREISGSPWNLFSILEQLPFGAHSVTLSVSLTAPTGTSLAEGEALLIDSPVITDWNGYVNNLFVNLISDWIPAYIKDADQAQTNPPEILRRFLHGATDIGSDVIQKVRDFHYRSLADGGLTGDTSSLLDGRYADDAWLEWLGQLQGLRVHPELSSGFSSWRLLQENAPAWEDWEANFTSWAVLESAYPNVLDALEVLRAQIISNAGGTLTGSLAGMRAAVKETLTGDKFVNVVTHIRDDPWLVAIETRDSETPAVDTTMLVANQVKPAGVRLYHEISRRGYAYETARAGSTNDLKYVESINRGLSENTAHGSAARFALNVGAYGDPFGELDSVAVDPDGNIYGLSNYAVYKFTLTSSAGFVMPNYSSGVMVAGTGVSGNGSTELQYPTSLTIDSDGYIYVGDFFENYPIASGGMVKRFPPNSTSGTAWTLVAGGTGNGSNNPGKMGVPADLKVDADKNIYVVDSWDRRVRKWASGALSGEILGRTNTTYNYQPTSIDVDPDGNIYITEWRDGYNNFGILKKFTIGGSLYGVPLYQANPSIIPGQFLSFTLSKPWGVALDSNGLIYTADPTTRYVLQWSPIEDPYGGNSANYYATKKVAEYPPLFGPGKIVFDDNDWLYIADSRRKYQYYDGNSPLSEKIVVMGQ